MEYFSPWTFPVSRLQGDMRLLFQVGCPWRTHLVNGPRRWTVTQVPCSASLFINVLDGTTNYWEKINTKPTYTSFSWGPWRALVAVATCFQKRLWLSLAIEVGSWKLFGLVSVEIFWLIQSGNWISKLKGHGIGVPVHKTLSNVVTYEPPSSNVRLFEKLYTG